MFCLAKLSAPTTSIEAAVFCAVLVRFSAVTTTSLSWATSPGCTLVDDCPAALAPSPGPGLGGPEPPTVVEMAEDEALGRTGAAAPGWAKAGEVAEIMAIEAAVVSKAVCRKRNPPRNLVVRAAQCVSPGLC